MCLVRPALLIDIHRLAELQQITQQITQQGAHGGRCVITGARVRQRTLEDAFARDADGQSALQTQSPLAGLVARERR